APAPPAARPGRTPPCAYPRASSPRCPTPPPPAPTPGRPPPAPRGARGPASAPAPAPATSPAGCSRGPCGHRPRSRCATCEFSLARSMLGPGTELSPIVRFAKGLKVLLHARLVFLRVSQQLGLPFRRASEGDEMIDVGRAATPAAPQLVPRHDLPDRAQQVPQPRRVGVAGVQADAVFERLELVQHEGLAFDLEGRQVRRRRR